MRIYIKPGILRSLVLCLLIAGYGTVVAQTASGVRWDQTYGGDQDELSYWGNIKLELNPGGGFYIGAISASGISGEKSEVCRGLDDYWILRLDANGGVIWDKTYGGDKRETLNEILLHPNGDLFVTGISFSNISGDKAVPNYILAANNYDIWGLRLDNTGAKVWEQVYGSTQRDNAFDIIANSAGNLLFGGLTRANPVPDGDVTLPTRGDADNWVFEVDPNSTLVLSQDRWGGNDLDQVFEILSDGSGGYFFASTSVGAPVFELPGPDRGDEDVVIYHMDASGSTLWSKRIGSSSGEEQLPHLALTPTGGCIITTATDGAPDGDRIKTGYGKRDIWAVELDNTGAVLWENVYGGNKDEEPFGIIPTCDGNYLIGGYSYSDVSGSKVSPSHGDSDMWFVKIDPQGNQIWDYAAGGSLEDGATDLEQFPDGTYGAVGYSNSNVSGDKSQPSRGGYDVWMVNLAVKADFSFPSACEGQQVQFSDQSTRFTQTWQWDFGDPASGMQNQSTDQHPTHTYASSGNYNVTLIVGEGCHLDTIVQTLTVHPTPSAFTGPDQIVCPGLTATLGGPPQSGLTYQWSPANGISQSQVSSPVFSGPYGVYQYSLLVSNGICADSQAVQVVSMDVDAGPDGEVCADESYSIGMLPPLPGVTYSWSPPSAVLNPGAAQTQYTPNNSGNETLVLTAIGGNCTLTDQVTVYSSPPITAAFVVNPHRPAPGQATDFNYSGSGGNTFVWSNGATGVQTQFIWQEPGEFLVTISASDSGRCVEEYSELIYVDPDVILFVPTAFTPNGDGLNDVFSFVIDRFTDFDITIFDRWGMEIFTSQSVNRFWDGEGYPEGIYSWKISGHSLTGSVFARSGIVTLIR